MALLGLVEKDERFTTVEMNINYVSPFREGNITAEARIINKGSRIALGDVDVRDDQGGLVAKCLATYTIMKKDRKLRRRVDDIVKIMSHVNR